jgi:hypothetical protein
LGGLVGSIFDLASGDPTEKEQKRFGSLSDEQLAAGQGAETAAQTYDMNLLNDPTKALAPEISAGQGQVEQQQLQNSNFGNRGGGTNASTQNAENANRGNIINLMGETQGQAASALGSLGTSEVGTGSSALGNEADLANQRRQQQVSDVNGVAQGAASIATGMMGGGAGAAAGGDPYETLYSAQHPDTGSMSTDSLDLGYL